MVLRQANVGGNASIVLEGNTIKLLDNDEVSVIDLASLNANEFNYVLPCPKKPTTRQQAR